MTLPVWVTPAGFLGTLTERHSVSYELDATGPGVSYSVISGALPLGLYVEGSTIVGTPNSVPVLSTSKFVIRASNQFGIADRTFAFDVIGPSEPVWVTQPGALEVGPLGEPYAINREYVKYTLLADTDTLTVGTRLKYFIAEGDGELPPGLTLSDDGVISGYLDDVLTLTITPNVGDTGGYDSEPYSYYPYDYSMVVSDSDELVKPYLTNKVYQFYVTVTDGVLGSRRLFSIDVMDPRMLPTNQQNISPVWVDNSGDILPSEYNLGRIRTNTNQVLALYQYDPYKLQSDTLFDWNTIIVNPDIQLIADGKPGIDGKTTVNKAGQSHLYYRGASQTPQVGMKLQLDEYSGNTLGDVTSHVHTVLNVIKTSLTSGLLILDKPLAASIDDDELLYAGSDSVHPYALALDSVSGSIYGSIKDQPLFGEDYRFTVKMVKISTDGFTSLYDAIGSDDARIVAKYNSLSTSPTSVLPTNYSGMIGDIILVASSNNGSAIVSKNAYVYTGTPGELAWVCLGPAVEVSQIFTLSVAGAIPNHITFVSTSSLGTLTPGQISELSVVANSSDPTYPIEYTLVSGALPTGLTLMSDGTIQGTVVGSGQTYIDLVESSATFVGSVVDNILYVNTVTNGEIQPHQRLVEMPDTHIVSGSGNVWTLASNATTSTIVVVDGTEFESIIPVTLNYSTATFHTTTSEPGRLDELTTTDDSSTTFDNNWHFTVRASDTYRLSSVEQEFYINVYRDVLGDFTRIYVKPFLTPSQRAVYHAFVSDTTIFDPALIYRDTDPEFGIQPEISMLLEPSIEEVDINEYVPAMKDFFYRKSFWFGDVKSIPATDSAGNVVYELVYIDIIDDQMTADGKTPPTAISVDNMRYQLETIQLSNMSTIAINERLEPRYMSTIQSDTGHRLGFIKAVPLCYTVPGGSPKILSRIASSKFDFKQYHFDTDRIIMKLAGKETWLLNPTDLR